ncbi:glycosyltransferase [Sphingomonas lycopersici]|uniref:Glycosyltransferase n=1 Tax=Sphingomonas lycopersici TaxID=2951807 RepID=A0AA41Z9A6_9SPHN|nr:glycosyltransferase [Sphingomonas lycopersici]MCW6529899.1 glycosyltransferase [Sphingomonas lycopersici]MCW6535298.1 glycosyltransferase [Sphingomonas lycopersici]
MNSVGKASFGTPAAHSPLPFATAAGGGGGRAIAVLMAVVTLYGLYSVPGLIRHWGGIDAAALLVLALWLAAAALAIPLFARRPAGRTWLVLLLVTAGLRIGVAIPCLDRVPGGDALFYPLLAYSLSHGHGLQVHEPFIGETVRALYPPLYPLVLAGWHGAFGLATGALCALNLLIDGAAALLVARLGQRTGHAGAGRAAAWLYMIWPSVLLSSPLAQKEGLVALLVLALAHAWLRARVRADRRAIALIGVASGLLALTQPALAPLSAILGLLLMWRTPPALIRAASGGAIVAALLMLPWWIRNWLAFHTFIPLTSAGGISLWIGNNPDATGNWIAAPAALRGIPELAYSRTLAAMAWHWIEQNPAGFVRLTLQKFFRAMAIAQAEVARLGDMRPAPSPRLAQSLFPVAQATHLLLIGTAALALWRRPRGAVALLVAACLIQLALFNIWFEFGERHREFLTPFLLLLGCACAPDFLDSLRERHRRRTDESDNRLPARRAAWRLFGPFGGIR